MAHADAGVLDLTLAGFTPELERRLPDLSEAGWAAGMAAGDEAAVV